MADEMEKKDETVEVSIEDLQAQIAQLQKDNEKLKQANTNASADAAEYKRKLREKQSAEEKRAEEEAEEKRKMSERIAELEAAQRNEKGKAGFIGFGFSESAALSATEAFYNGDFDGFTTIMKTFLSDHDKAIKAESVRGMTPPASGGTGPKQYTKEDFDKMSYRELNELYTKDPEQYEKLRNS